MMAVAEVAAHTQSSAHVHTDSPDHHQLQVLARPVHHAWDTISCPRPFSRLVLYSFLTCLVHPSFVHFSPSFPYG